MPTAKVKKQGAAACELPNSLFLPSGICFLKNSYMAMLQIRRMGARNKQGKRRERRKATARAREKRDLSLFSLSRFSSF